MAEHGPAPRAGSDGEAGGGVQDICRHGGILRVQVPRGTGHVVRPHGASLLQELLHRGIGRLHLRQRALAVRRVPGPRNSTADGRIDGAGS